MNAPEVSENNSRIQVVTRPSRNVHRFTINRACIDEVYLGENPLWHDGFVYWTDIKMGKLWKFRTDHGPNSLIYEGLPVGGFTMQDDGNLLLFRVNDIAILDPKGKLLACRPYPNEASRRFNDVIADPMGRVFAGTIGTTPESGGVYRLDPDGSLKLLFAGTGCSNGMGFSPDLKTFYWTCSTQRKIFCFDYEVETGTIDNRRLFYEARRDEGIPDGLTVNESGQILSARWAGHAIFIHEPDGWVSERLYFDDHHITSMCFGGEHLDCLYVTAANDILKSNTTAIYKVSGISRGKPEYKSQIRL